MHLRRVTEIEALRILRPTRLGNRRAAVGAMLCMRDQGARRTVLTYALLPEIFRAKHSTLRARDPK